MLPHIICKLLKRLGNLFNLRVVATMHLSTMTSHVLFAILLLSHIEDSEHHRHGMIACDLFLVANILLHFVHEETPLIESVLIVVVGSSEIESERLVI